MVLEPDPRWKYICGGLTSSGQPMPMSAEILGSLANEWAKVVGDVAPSGGTELLSKAGSLALRAWFDYDLLTTACLTALQAVEAAFRQVLFPDARDKVPFGNWLTGPSERVSSITINPR